MMFIRSDIEEYIEINEYKALYYYSVDGQNKVTGMVGSWDNETTWEAYAPEFKLDKTNVKTFDEAYEILASRLDASS